MLLFPVNVHNHDRSEVVASKAKVHASQGVTYVYVWNREDRQVQLVAEVAGVPTTEGHRQWTVGEGDQQLHLAETGGCGCGHPLKRWSPPRPVTA